ncbi:hypothetical protein NM65012_2185 [Neisseria meningitidis 65012]|nr:hypothetical protein NM69155_2153 [Neisseria meningitidis 69155]EOB70562.1 hypothetical protein NM65012_2185 [Neisseria meningitidis 65012]
MAVFADAAALYPQMVGLVFGNIIACGFGLVIDCAAQCAAAGFERVRAFGDGYFGKVFRLGSVAVGVEVAVRAEQFLEGFGRAAFRLRQPVNVDGDAVFVHAAYGKAVRTRPAAFDDGNAGVVAHQVVFVVDQELV